MKVSRKEAIAEEDHLDGKQGEHTKMRRDAGKRLPRPTETQENEMSESTVHQVTRQHYENLRREAAKVRPAPMAHANHETRPYVVRDLSWELARFLDSETFPASAFAAPDSANGNPPRPR